MIGGRLITWNDLRGFGFILRDDDAPGYFRSRHRVRARRH